MHCSCIGVCQIRPNSARNLAEAEFGKNGRISDLPKPKFGATLISGNDCWKRYVFSCCQNVKRDGEDWRWTRNEFQTHRHKHGLNFNSETYASVTNLRRLLKTLLFHRDSVHCDFLLKPCICTLTLAYLLTTNITANKTLTPFSGVIKVIQGHWAWCQSKAHNFLLVINCNFGHISYCFRDTDA